VVSENQWLLKIRCQIVQEWLKKHPKKRKEKKRTVGRKRKR
jgi:hypothetical protein